MEHNHQSAAAFAYCRRVVSAADDDLALALPYADRTEQPRLTALAAFQIELRRIPSLVSEAALGEIRLQWWREALDGVSACARAAHPAAGDGRPREQVRAHPVVEALAYSGALEDEQTRQLAEASIEARSRLLYGEPFTTIADLSNFLVAAEAWHGVAAGRGRVEAQSLNHFALAHALSRWGRVHAPDLAAAIADVGAMHLAACRPVFSGPIAPAVAGAVLYLSLTPGHLRRRQGAPWLIAKRITLLRAALSGVLLP